MGVSYTLYIHDPPSRNLYMRVDPEGTEWRRLEDLHRIDGHVRSLVEDLAELLPAGYSVDLVKEHAE